MEAMFFPKPRQPSTAGDQSNFTVADGFVTFTKEFRYLGSIIHQSLTSDADIDRRINKARAGYAALRDSFFDNRLAKPVDKGRVYIALILSILLYGSEAWCLREDLFNRLRTFYNSCVRAMCRVTMSQTWRHRITTKSLLERLQIRSFDDYYYTRLLRWAGHVVRMPMERTPRRLLTGWVDHPRALGAPQMTIGRTINKALRAKNLPTDFQAWTKLAKDRPQWRAITHPHNPKYGGENDSDEN